MSIALFLFGGVSFAVERNYCTEFLNLCLSHGYPYSDFHCGERGEICMRFPLYVVRRLTSDCDARGIPFRILSKTGLPFIFLRLWKRVHADLCGRSLDFVVLDDLMTKLHTFVADIYPGSRDDAVDLVLRFSAE